MRAPNVQGYVTYHGPSMIDGDPIVSILTGFGGTSRNPKTGPMIQHWILRADRRPGEAIRDGSDHAICGSCPLRMPAEGEEGVRRCYVNPMGPSSVYKSWQAGHYEEGVPAALEIPVRFGAYGDPAALPIAHLRQLAEIARAGHTGYTHQWRAARAAGFAGLLMASVETVAERDAAHAKGWRTFRVATGETRGDLVCPASEEGGKRSTCGSCRLCNGSTGHADLRRSIVILPHGPAEGRF